MKKKDRLVRVDNRVARGVLCGVPQSLICERLLFASIGNFNPAGGNVAVEFDVSNVMKGCVDKEKTKRIDSLCTKMFGCHIAEVIKNGTWRTAIFNEMVVDNDTNKIIAMFNPKALPYIVGLQKEYTMIPLESYLGLSSKYSAVLYRALKSYSGFGKCIPIKINSDELMELIGAPARARRDSWWFKSKTLEPAIKEINEVMDIIISYKAVKKGRSVVRYDFNIELKESVVDSLRKRKTQEFYAKNPEIAKEKRDQDKMCGAINALECMEASGEIVGFLDGLTYIRNED